MCLLNIERSGPLPLSTTTAKTDSWEDMSLGNMQEDEGKDGVYGQEVCVWGATAPAVLLPSRASLVFLHDISSGYPPTKGQASN